MTHFLILLFIFVTLFAVAAGRLFSPNNAGIVFTFIWSALGTFVAHTFLS